MPRNPENDRLIFLIIMAQHRLRMNIRDRLKADGVKITLVQAGILFLLKQKNGRTMSEASQILSLDNSTITGLTDRLEKSGFVKRQADPSDRRVSLIHITPEGLGEADRARIVINAVNEEIKADFTKKEIETFKKVLNGFLTKFR